MARALNTFNPSAYVLTAAETWERKQAYDKFVSENVHLAMPFHIEGLEGIIPPQYPGETAMVEARGHHGKSTILKDILWKAQKQIEGKPGFLIGAVILEDTAERTASQQVRRYDGNEIQYVDDQFVHIGRSFGMRTEDMAELYMSNISRALEYGKNKKFAETMHYSLIAIDYAQIIPPDPERRMMTTDQQRRLQIADDIKRITNMAVYYTCPVVVASQALTKTQRSNYSEKMKIPGAADMEEAKELFNIPDIVYAYWQPKHDWPMGMQIEDGNWCFKVSPNLIFMRVVKRRYAEELGYSGERDVVGRVFPCHIEPSGNIVYDPDFHKKIHIGGKLL